MEGREIKRITFDDQGQDFMTFDVDSTGAITDVWPFQYGMWSRCSVVNLDGLKPGDLVQLDGNGDFPIAPGYRLNYPVVSVENIVFSAEKIEALEREYNGWKDSPESEKRSLMMKQLKAKLDRVKASPGDSEDRALPGFPSLMERRKTKYVSGSKEGIVIKSTHEQAKKLRSKL